jgi:hypothetical protein
MSTNGCKRVQNGTKDSPIHIMTPEPGVTTEQVLRQHTENLLDAVSLRDLPTNEIYEFEDGVTMVKHHMRYANFFKEVCLEQQDLLEGLAHSEENYFLVRRTAREHRREYLGKCDDLCSFLRKRLDRPDTDSEEDFYPNEGSYQIPRK